MIRVLYYAGIRELTGTVETKVESFSGTLAGLLKHLNEHHEISLIAPSQDGGDGSDDPLAALIIMINGRHVAHVGGINAPVADGDTVTVFPLIGGG